MHRRPTPKQYPSDFIGGKPVLSTGYLVSCSRTQRSVSGEARTRNPSISGQALYHDCAPQLGSILCRQDTCPTQYAPDLRGSILCMQGTQYAPRESILCMEHFVALQCRLFVLILVSGWLKSTRDTFAGNCMAYACEGNAKSVRWRGQLAIDRHCMTVWSCM